MSPETGLEDAEAAAFLSLHVMVSKHLFNPSLTCRGRGEGHPFTHSLRVWPGSSQALALEDQILPLLSSLIPGPRTLGDSADLLQTFRKLWGVHCGQRTLAVGLWGLSLLRSGKGGQVLDMSDRLPPESFHQYIGVGDSGVGLWGQREYLSELGEPAEKCERTGFRKLGWLLGSSLATALWVQGRETQWCHRESHWRHSDEAWHTLSYSGSRSPLLASLAANLLPYLGRNP